MDIKDKHVAGLLSELNASKSLRGIGSNADPVDVAYNQGLSKAIGFVKAYRAGKGLFQITDDSPKPA